MASEQFPILPSSLFHMPSGLCLIYRSEYRAVKDESRLALHLAVRKLLRLDSTATCARTSHRASPWRRGAHPCSSRRRSSQFCLSIVHSSARGTHRRGHPSSWLANSALDSHVSDLFQSSSNNTFFLLLPRLSSILSSAWSSSMISSISGGLHIPRQVSAGVGCCVQRVHKLESHAGTRCQLQRVVRSVHCPRGVFLPVRG